MNKYSTSKLKRECKKLYNEVDSQIWRELNIELAKRLGKTEYLNFIVSFR